MNPCDHISDSALEQRRGLSRGSRPPSDHEAVLLAVVGHEDDVAVGGPDEAGELQVVLGARGRRLHRGDLVGLNAAELGGRVQHADAAQQTGVHLRRTGNKEDPLNLIKPSV